MLEAGLACTAAHLDSRPRLEQVPLGDHADQLRLAVKGEPSHDGLVSSAAAAQGSTRRRRAPPRLSQACCQHPQRTLWLPSRSTTGRPAAPSSSAAASASGASGCATTTSPCGGGRMVRGRLGGVKVGGPAALEASRDSGLLATETAGHRTRVVIRLNHQPA